MKWKIKQSHRSKQVKFLFTEARTWFESTEYYNWGKYNAVIQIKIGKYRAIINDTVLLAFLELFQFNLEPRHHAFTDVDKAEYGRRSIALIYVFQGVIQPSRYFLDQFVAESYRAIIFCTVHGGRWLQDVNRFFVSIQESIQVFLFINPTQTLLFQSLKPFFPMLCTLRGNFCFLVFVIPNLRIDIRNSHGFFSETTTLLLNSSIDIFERQLEFLDLDLAFFPQILLLFRTIINL